jgi:voltage-gated potassium channel
MKDVDRKFMIRVGWQIFMCAAIYYSAIESPLNFALHVPLEESNLWWDAIVSTIFLTDFLLNLSGKIRFKPDEVAHIPGIEIDHRPYTRTPVFFIDLMAAIPFDIIANLTGGAGYLKLLQLLRLLKMVNMIKLFRIFNSLTVLPKGIKLVSVFLGMTLVMHWIACGWMVIYPNPELDNLTFYNTSLYWSLTTLTTIGYGDITPTTNGGRFYTMIIMVTGVVFYGIVIGNVSSLIMRADRHAEANKEKMNDLHLYMKHYRIPYSLQRQVFSFYKHILEKRLSDNDTKIIGELPQALQEELRIYMKMKLIQTVPIFKGQKLSCLKMIAGRLEQAFYTPGQNIVKEGDSGQEMFIIGHGEAEVFVADKCVATLKEGQYFGEIALLEATTRNAAVRSKAYCDLYTLNKPDFVEIVERFPELGEKFRSTYKDRLSKQPPQENQRENRNKPGKSVA